MKHVDNKTERAMIAAHQRAARARIARARMLEGQAKAAKVMCDFIAEDAERARLKRDEPSHDELNAKAMRDFRAKLGDKTR